MIQRLNKMLMNVHLSASFYFQVRNIFVFKSRSSLNHLKFYFEWAVGAPSTPKFISDVWQVRQVLQNLFRVCGGRAKYSKIIFGCVVGAPSAPKLFSGVWRLTNRFILNQLNQRSSLCRNLRNLPTIFLFFNLNNVYFASAKSFLLRIPENKKPVEGFFPSTGFLRLFKFKAI